MSDKIHYFGQEVTEEEYEKLLYADLVDRWRENKLYPKQSHFVMAE